MGKLKIGEDDVKYLKKQFELGRMILFTGAGFSKGIADIDGNFLPSGDDFAKELWELIFPNEPITDNFSLQEIFEVGISTAKNRLGEYIH